MKPEEFLDVLWQERMSAVLRTNQQEPAAKAMEAAILGGFRIVEFTLTIPGAMELIKQFSWHSDLIVGAGTVLSAQSARDAVSAGARFLVSPVVDPDVIQEAKNLGVSFVPGASTPTEMLLAYRQGAQLQKLFPAPAGGPAFVRALLGPMPFLRVVPSHSGVDADTASAYLEAGSYAVAFGNPLFDPEDIRKERFDQIEERAKNLKEIVTAAKRPA